MCLVSTPVDWDDLSKHKHSVLMATCVRSKSRATYYIESCARTRADVGTASSGDGYGVSSTDWFGDPITVSARHGDIYHRPTIKHGMYFIISPAPTPPTLSPAEWNSTTMKSKMRTPQVRARAQPGPAGPSYPTLNIDDPDSEKPRLWPGPSLSRP